MRLSFNSPVVLLFVIASLFELALAFATGGASTKFFVTPNPSPSTGRRAGSDRSRTSWVTSPSTTSPGT